MYLYCFIENMTAAQYAKQSTYLNFLSKSGLLTHYEAFFEQHGFLFANLKEALGLR